MICRRAHLLCLLLAAPAPVAACGVVSGFTQIQTIGLELVLADGRRARLGGLQLDPHATLAEWSGLQLGVALLAPKPDRWGRLVVDLVAPNGGSVALDLLARGLARVRPEAETRVCEAERLDAEGGARAAGEGVWSEPGAVLDAGDPAALAAADGRFALVSGVVRSVGVRRSKIYLDFAVSGGFAVVVTRKLEPQFLSAGVDLATLAGQRVRVRGVMDVRFGARIDIVDPAMIEILDKGTGRGG